MYLCMRMTFGISKVDMSQLLKKMERLIGQF
jgi:hypothetical protein